MCLMPVRSPRSAPSAGEPTELEKQMNRRRFLDRVYKTAVIAAGAYAADSVRAILPTDQPQPLDASHPQYNYANASLPGPNDDIDMILRNLQTDDQVCAFMKEHTTHVMPNDVFEFCSTYRKSPAEWQRDGWRGACNCYAEFWCHWGTIHNKNMYLVTLQPGPDATYADKASSMCAHAAGEEGSKKGGKSWHIVSVYRRHNPNSGEYEYVIYSNGTKELWTGTIEEYANTKNMVIPSWSGVTRWARTQDDFRARLYAQLGPNVQQMEETVDPFPAQMPNVMIAQK